jgi:hypothetical protein
MASVDRTSQKPPFDIAQVLNTDATVAPAPNKRGDGWLSGGQRRILSELRTPVTGKLIHYRDYGPLGISSAGTARIMPAAGGERDVPAGSFLSPGMMKNMYRAAREGDIKFFRRYFGSVGEENSKSAAPDLALLSAHAIADGLDHKDAPDEYVLAAGFLARMAGVAANGGKDNPPPDTVRELVEKLRPDAALYFGLALTMNPGADPEWDTVLDNIQKAVRNAPPTPAGQEFLKGIKGGRVDSKDV